MTRVDFANARYLLEVVDRSDSSLVSVIRGVYSRHALAYAETLAFLTALEVLPMRRRTDRTRSMFCRDDEQFGERSFEVHAVSGRASSGIAIRVRS